MNRTFLLIIIILSSVNATDAQGYFQNIVAKYISGYTMEQLNSDMDKAMKLKSTGRTKTIVGTLGMIIGLISLSNWSLYNSSGNDVAIVVY